MESLQVSLFGGFQLRRGELTVAPMASRAARLLFAYLAVHRGVRHPREHLAAQFWPDLPAARARRRLSHSLWQIQDALSELDGDATYVEVTSDTLSFAPSAPALVDVETFEAGLDRIRARRSQSARTRDLTDLETTVATYRGEFLAGHPDPWVEHQQERLHMRYLEALAWLVGIAKGLGAHEDALIYARRLANEDPLREDAHREVMRLCTLLGRPSEAVRQYERCVEVLAEELGTSPSEATEELHQRILRRQHLEPVESSPLEPLQADTLPLLGRERERAVAVTVLERALEGRGGAVLVEGEPGVGITRLLSEVVDDAHWRGFTVASVSCTSPDAQLPFGVVRELLGTLLGPLRLEQLRHRLSPIALATVAQLVPALGRVVPATVVGLDRLRGSEGAERLQDALLDVLQVLSGSDPLLLAVDGAHWADPESLEVLTALATDASRHRLVVVLGYRGDEARAHGSVWAALRGLDLRARPERVLLSGLDAFSTGELVRLLIRGGRVSSAAISRLQRETGGNPLFLLETVRALRELDELAALEDDAPLPLPTSIRDIVLGRLRDLGPEPRHVLDLAAVAGDGVSLDLLSEASDIPGEVVVDAATTLVRRDLLLQGIEELRFPHDQVRRALLEDLDQDALRALHRRVAAAIERRQPDAVERLAYHYREAGESVAAAVYLHRAGRNAARLHAYLTSDRYYTEAVAQRDRAPVSVETRYELLAEHEAVLDVLGERERQADVLRELATLASEHPRHAVDVARRQALLGGHLGDLDDALALAGRAAEEAAAFADPDLRAQTSLAHASVLTWAGRRQDAADVLEAAGRSAVSERLRAEVLAQHGSVLRELQRYDEAESVLEAALDAAVSVADAREEAVVLGVLGAVRMETGACEAAVVLYTRAIDRAVAIGFRRAVAVTLVNRGFAHYHLGDPVAAGADYDAALQRFSRLGDRRGHAAVLLNRANLRSALLGDDSGAMEDLEPAFAHFRRSRDGRFLALCHDTRAAIALRRGDLEMASREADLAYAAAAPEEAGWALVQVHERLAAVALARGEPAIAVEHARNAWSSAVEHGARDRVPLVRSLEGEALLALGEGEAAFEATAAAVEALHAGVERGYLVRYRHHLTAAAIGRRDVAAREAAAAAEELHRVVGQLEPAARELALGCPEHRRILDAAAGVSVGRTLVVASAQAPLGRSLRAEEYLEVVVDLALPGSAPADPLERRRATLLHVLDQLAEAGGLPTVEDLASALEVSTATTRRDLAALRAGGRLVRTRGNRTA